MKTSHTLAKASMVVLVTLGSCGTEPVEEHLKVLLQYRITSTYSDSTAAPLINATARANLSNQQLKNENIVFAINAVNLEQNAEGMHILNNAIIIAAPYVVEWSAKGFQDTSVSTTDTILPPILIKIFHSGDTISKTKGATIAYTIALNTSTSDVNRIYGMIVKDFGSGPREITDDTHSMFDQPDNGMIVVSQAILSGLRPNTRYKLSVERGKSREVTVRNIDVISNSFSEMSTYFFLED